MLPAIEGDDGKLVERPVAVADAKLAHFAEMDSGTIQTEQQAADTYNRARLQRPKDVELHIASVPSLLHLLKRIQCANKGKVTNVQSTVNDLLQRAPTEAAQIIHPLNTKINLARREPFQHNCSIVFGLHKKGNIVKRSSYRSMALGNLVSKHHHKFMRSQAPVFLEAAFLDTQAGDLPGRCTAQANLAVRAQGQLLQA